MKKLFYSAVSLALYAAPLAASAQTNGGLANLDDLNLNGDIDLINLVGRVINVLLGFLGVIALVIIIYAGFLWMTAAGNDEQISKAKKMLGAAVIGMIIIVSSLAIANFVIARLKEVGGGDW